MPVKSICGIILCSDSPQKLSEFYSQVLEVEFEQEEHGDLLTHYGVDIGQIHFGIHPPQNMQREQVGNANISVAFNVDSLDTSMQKAEKLGATCVTPPHDEGFGMVVSLLDIDGNMFELVELDYNFSEN